ncbi:hypothetical protein FIBSPDRAFT_867698 [Athelia psychrophila]|uniref:Uncharacterized protein n=1 Tax=Athelia psychrophila TaxID=1759441 RepID=A0A165ZCY2_9AGAM|nr:hypothetical protein FIBSPDRAFT_872544 [Fibularhizoctonia sp. CBS 109695]KZP15077.1 hypothetical protein FIBSPDRAFT_867698 [Fibularhizoctonia sp. CBS 109695]
MQFLLLTLAAVASATPTRRVTCAEAARFGTLEVVPSKVKVGGSFTVHADFTCSLYFNIIPKYIDYYIEVTANNNGHEPPILLARREFHHSTGTPPTDTFSTSIPDAYYFKGAAYQVVLDVTYAANGTTGAPYYQVGGTETGITIAGIAS